MSKRLILALLLAFFAVQAFGQDIIHTKDQRTIEARVLEIGEETLRYKLFINLEGPDFMMSVSRVDWIEFENGTSWQASAAGVQEEEEPVDDIGPISYRWGHFYSPYGILYDDDLDYYLGMSMFGSDYRKALSRYSWGEWLTVGGAMTIASCIIAGIADSGLDRIANYHGMQPSGSGDGVISATALFGAVCLGAGIPLWISGNRRLNQLADEYNQSHRGRSYGSAAPATLQFGPTRNGLGLALNF